MTTLTQVKARYPQFTVSQEGAKQLFTVFTPRGNHFVLSYDTIVACAVNAVLYITKEKYSSTTSRHCSLLSRQYAAHQHVDVDELQLIVSANIIF